MARKPIKQTDVEKRVDDVRAAVAQASTGLKGKKYRQLMEALISDAEGWRMELDESEDDGEGDD